MAVDETMIRIGQGMQLSQSGDRASARELFARIWAGLGGEAGDPFYCCALAHAMADLQDDVHDELVWDRRALAAADLITDERAASAGISAGVAGFYPSLHLNLGDCYRRLDDFDQAHEHLRQGLAAVNSLGDDGYGLMIRRGLERLGERLGASPTSPLPTTHT
jgi:tetratricopeptide (TPR) repeat protein